MKKLLSLVLAAVMLTTALFAFASCGKEEKFVIGITYFEPMNYFDENNQLTGFETEFAKAVCEKLGLTPEFVEIDWSTKEVELNAGTIDCIWNGMTIDDDRKATMGISDPYMENMQVLVTKKDKVDLFITGTDSVTLCSEDGSAGESVIMGTDFGDKVGGKIRRWQHTPVDTMAKALMEVAAGTSDACIIDYVTSIGMIGEGTDYADLVTVDGYEFGLEYYGIAFRKEDTETLEKFNKAIRELMEDGTVAKIAAKYKLEDQLVK